MKICKNILFKVLFLLVLISGSSSQELLEGDITLDLDVLPTGGLTLNTWNSLNGLWSVRLENTTNQIKQYRLYFEMRKGNQLMVGKKNPVVK